MDRRYCDFVCGMSEGGGVCVRRDWGREGRGWGLGGICGRNGIQGVLAVPYIPVQGSPGVFRESWGVGDRVFGWVFVICGVEVAYVRKIGLLRWWLWAVRSGVVLTT